MRRAAALAAPAARGLTLVQRNYRVARGPGARGGEIDLIMRERDGTLVFVEVRARARRGHGGAAASVGAAKQRRLVFAARHFLHALPRAALPLRRGRGRRHGHRVAAWRLRRRAAERRAEAALLAASARSEHDRQ